MHSNKNPKHGELFAPFQRTNRDALDASTEALRTPPTYPRHPGFTLVELLVVIVIIGLIAGISVPIVMQALTSARNAAIKTEIDMLQMAMMNYRNEFGSFPPAASLTTGQNDPAVKHLRRLFVRCPNPTAQLQSVLGSQSITPANSLGFWLSGYTGSPESPLSVANSAPRRSLYNFDRARLDTTSFQYRLSHTGETPVLYIDNARYIDVDGSSVDGQTIYVWRNDSLFAPRTTPPPLLQTNTNQTIFHPDSFQIISAGRDKEFYTDDDLSNMWPGTWGDWKLAKKLEK